MISNQILQNTIDGVKGITKIDLSVVDADGKIVYSHIGYAPGSELELLKAIKKLQK